MKQTANNNSDALEYDIKQLMNCYYIIFLAHKYLFAKFDLLDYLCCY